MLEDGSLIDDANEIVVVELGMGRQDARTEGRQSLNRKRSFYGRYSFLRKEEMQRSNRQNP